MKILVAIAVFLIAVLVPTAANAHTHTSVGVTGSTSWIGEYRQTLSYLQAIGVPIHDGCAAGEDCITLTQYRAADGLAGHTDGFTGNATVSINTQYDPGDNAGRRETLTHELGHALGLWQHGGCDTSMEPQIAQCGHYIIGYTPLEQQHLHEIWSQ